MSVFNYDHTLPALPIADLDDTCTNLKSIAKPVLDHSTWETLCSALDSFQQESGPALQDKLLSWQEQRGNNSSWLRPIWDDNYLSYRDRLPVNMNYTYQLLLGRFGDNPLPKLLHSTCCILDQLRTEQLPVEQIRDTPLSMEALTHMIYTRIPSTHCDMLYYPPASTPYTAAIVCKGHWFLLSLTAPDRTVLSPETIGRALDRIRSESAQLPAAISVGSLTSAKREDAAVLRTELLKNPLNRMNLESLENAICVVCLDDLEEKGFLHNLLLGDSSNRWFDKSLQIISADQHLGVNIEHSGCDGGMWVYLLSQIDVHIAEGSSCENSSDTTAQIRALDFILTDTVETLLLKETGEYNDFISTIAVADGKLENFSRAKLKEFKCRPDATAQILYQATYYKLTGCFRSTYEAVSVRNFYQGRTECVRPCSSTVVDFVKDLVGGSDDKSALLEKFGIAQQAHMDQISRCQKGLGPERHMSGLMAMHTMYEDSTNLPAVFETDGFKTLKHDAISTSSTTAPYIEYFGFCPVVSDGISVGYGMKNDALHIAVAAFEASTIKPQQFIDTLNELASQLFTLFK